MKTFEQIYRLRETQWGGDPVDYGIGGPVGDEPWPKVRTCPECGCPDDTQCDCDAYAKMGAPDDWVPNPCKICGEDTCRSDCDICQACECGPIEDEEDPWDEYLAQGGKHTAAWQRLNPGYEEI